MFNRSPCLLGILAAIAVLPAQAQFNAVFEGSQTRVCINSNNGFDSNLALLGPSSITSGMDKRVVRFHHDGTGTASNKTIALSHSGAGAGSTPAFEVELECTFTYTVEPHGGAIHTLTSCDYNTLTGPTAGQIGRITNIKGEAVFLDRHQVLVSQATTPNVETVTNLSTGIVSQRICHRTSTLYRR